MDNTADINPVGTAARQAIDSSVGSVREASIQTGIPYATLDRRLRDGEQFKVSELRALGTITGRKPADFIGGEA